MGFTSEYVMAKFKANKDDKVIEDFGNEWTFFNNRASDKNELCRVFNQYFSKFPWSALPKHAEGFDMGCGNGRWAQFVAPRVKVLNCVEPSNAINVAKKNLNNLSNVKFYQETTETCSIKKSSQDFGYCLGVLHHIPDTEKALRDCSDLLKSGAPFLVYLYYDLENRPFWFRVLWMGSNFFRKIVSKQNLRVKLLICYFIALFLYLPLSRLSGFVDKLGLETKNIPLSFYKNKSFYMLKNDALDRFGTRLEKRYSKSEIINMLQNSGFEKIVFSESSPFWCCISVKK